MLEIHAIGAVIQKPMAEPHGWTCPRCGNLTMLSAVPVQVIAIACPGCGQPHEMRAN